MLVKKHEYLFHLHEFGNQLDQNQGQVHLAVTIIISRPDWNETSLYHRLKVAQNRAKAKQVWEDKHVAARPERAQAWTPLQTL